MFGFQLRADAQARGRRAFIWRWGVGLWGLPVAVASTLVQWREETGGLSWMPELSGHFLLRLGLALLIVGVGGGYLWGAGMWYLGTHE